MSKKAVKNNGKFGDALILTIFMVVSQSLVLGQDRNPNPLIYSFLDIYGILVSHEYIKATYGNAGAPLKHPYCESRPMLILIFYPRGAGTRVASRLLVLHCVAILGFFHVLVDSWM